jgi:hypothetical protein
LTAIWISHAIVDAGIFRLGYWLMMRGSTFGLIGDDPP